MSSKERKTHFNCGIRSIKIKIDKLSAETSLYEAPLYEKYLDKTQTGEIKLISLPILKSKMLNEKRNSDNCENGEKRWKKGKQKKKCEEEQQIFLENISVNDLTGAMKVKEKERKKSFEQKQSNFKRLNFDKQMLKERLGREMSQFEFKNQQQPKGVFFPLQKEHIKSEKVLNKGRNKFIPLLIEKEEEDDHIPKNIMKLVRKSKSQIFKKQVEECNLTKSLLATRDKFLINQIKKITLKKHGEKISFLKPLY